MSGGGKKLSGLCLALAESHVKDKDPQLKDKEMIQPPNQ